MKRFNPHIEREIDRSARWYWVVVGMFTVSAVLTQLRLWYWDITGDLDWLLFGTYLAGLAALFHLWKTTESMVITSYDTFKFSKIAQAVGPGPSDEALEEARRWILAEGYCASRMAAVAAHPMSVSISLVLIISGLVDIAIGRGDDTTVPLYLGTSNAYLLLGNAVLGSGAILLVLAIGMSFLVRRTSYYICGDTITERGMLHLKSILGDYQRRVSPGAE